MYLRRSLPQILTRYTLGQLLKHYNSTLVGGAVGYNPGYEICFGSGCPVGPVSQKFIPVTCLPNIIPRSVGTKLSTYSMLVRVVPTLLICSMKHKVRF
jgi:hypothetical protein